MKFFIEDNAPLVIIAAIILLFVAIATAFSIKDYKQDKMYIDAGYNYIPQTPAHWEKAK